MIREWKWTNFQIDKLNKIKEIVTELQDYWPLTLRQIYYQMVGKGHIHNTKSEYKMLSDSLTNARLDELIGWEVMEDRERAFLDMRGYSDPEAFVSNTLYQWLGWYSRNKQQGQESRIELWTEKYALASLFKRACSRYSVPVMICKGFMSTTWMNKYRNRINTSKKNILLYFGDYDPSGMYMSEKDLPKRIAKMNIDAEIRRIALCPGDPEKYNLFSDPVSFKPTDTRTPWFIAAGYGEIGYELDAVEPGELERLTSQTIESYLDMDLYHDAVAEAEGDKEALEEIASRME